MTASSGFCFSRQDSAWADALHQFSKVPGNATVLVSCDDGLANTKCDRLLLQSAYPVLGKVKDFRFDGLILAECVLGTAEIVAQLPGGGGRSNFVDDQTVKDCLWSGVLVRLGVDLRSLETVSPPASQDFSDISGTEVQPVQKSRRSPTAPLVELVVAPREQWCGICNVTIKGDHLARHTWAVHSQEKRFDLKCPHCGRVFSRKNRFTEHRDENCRRNIAVFPHLCGTCLVGFKTATKLFSHLVKRGRCKPAAAEVPAVVVGDVMDQQNYLEADQLQDMPVVSGDTTIQTVNLGEGDIVVHVPEDLEMMLRPDGPVTFIVAPGGADGSLHLQPML